MKLSFIMSTLSNAEKLCNYEIMEEYKFMIFNHSTQQAFIKNILCIIFCDRGIKDKHISALDSITKLALQNTQRMEGYKGIGDPDIYL